MTMDHLAEARRLAERLHPPRTHGQNFMRDAINHLADAIEELERTTVRFVGAARKPRRYTDEDHEVWSDGDDQPEYSKCPRCGVEHTDRPGKLCYHCGLEPPDEPETVPVLLPEHRDRQWTNRLGRRWRFNVVSQRWETLLETLDAPSWAPATTDESGQWATDFGPYTAVGEA